MDEKKEEIGGTDYPPNVEKTAGQERPTDQGDGGGNEPTGEAEQSSER